MEEKKVIYEVILSVWNLFKEYGFKQLTDDEWEKLIQRGNEMEKEFRSKSKSMNRLFRDMFAALQNYYIGKARENQNINGQISMNDLSERR